MWSEFVACLLKLKWFMVAEAVFGIALVIAFEVLLRNFKWNPNKIRVFGLFFQLQRRERVLIGLLLSKYIFIVSNLVFCVNLEWIHFIALELFVIWYNAVKMSPLGLVADTAVAGITFGGMLTANVLYQYLQQVIFDREVLVIMLCLGLFILLYSTYSMVLGIEKIMFEEISQIPEKDGKGETQAEEQRKGFGQRHTDKGRDEKKDKDKRKDKDRKVKIEGEKERYEKEQRKPV